MKGYTQQEGVYYEKTLSLVVRFASIHVILALVAHMDLKLVQMEVKTAFLHGELNKVILLDQSEGLVSKNHERKLAAQVIYLWTETIF